MKHISITLSLLIFSNLLFGQKIITVKIKGGEGIGKREVLIYTPNEYADMKRKFEVVYVLDAQNREYFDAVHTTIAFQNKGLRPMIVIGLISKNRNKDFLPKNVHPETIQEQYGQLGGADDFSDFIENKGKIKAAQKILLNFQDKLSGDIEDNNDIYTLFETGDLYYSLEFYDLAKKYFLFCESKLEANKKKYGAELYDFGKKKITEKLQLIDKSQYITEN